MMMVNKPLVLTYLYLLIYILLSSGVILYNKVIVFFVIIIIIIITIIINICLLFYIWTRKKMQQLATLFMKGWFVFRFKHPIKPVVHSFSNCVVLGMLACLPARLGYAGTLCFPLIFRSISLPSINFPLWIKPQLPIESFNSSTRV